ncbi:gamma-glutamyltransferase, partial [Bacillus sp. GbtcB14]
ISDYKDKLSHTAAKDVFLPDGEPLKEGDTLIQKDLAKTFTAIKYKGTKAFYDGAFSKKLAETVQEFGGSMTEKDIKNFNVTIDEPIWGD